MKRLWPICLLLIVGCGRSAPDIAKQAQSTDASQRLQAVHALQERTGEQNAVPVLVAALKDENVYVRRDAARALAHHGPAAKEAAPALTDRLRDREPSVRRAAAEALKRIDPAVAKVSGREAR